MGVVELWSSTGHLDFSHGGDLLSRLLPALPAEVDQPANYEDPEEPDVGEGPTPRRGLCCELWWAVKESHLAKSNTETKVRVN